MKTIHLKLRFPKNWYHARFLKIYSNKKLVTKMMHGDTQQIIVDENVKEISLRLDYFKNSIDLPTKEKDVYIVIFMDIGTGTLQHYLKSLNTKCIKGKVVTQQEFEEFDTTSFYANSQRWLSVAKIDKPTVYIGLMIGVVTLLYSIYSETEWRELLFLLGGGTVFSLIIIALEKNKIILGDYKARMWASVALFMLIFIVIPTTDYAVKMVIGILTLGFTLRFIKNNQELKINKEVS